MACSTENFYKTFQLVQQLIPYKICIKAINPEEILLRSSIQDFKEIKEFVRAYETVTHSRFKICANKSARSRRICVCSRKWTCNHSVVSGINEKCPANISILIKKINKANKLIDEYLKKIPPHPAVIQVNPNHNHPLKMPRTPSSMFKVNSGVKECFYEYFKRGYYGASAKCLHEQYLRKSNFQYIWDETMNPSLPAIFVLYNNWSEMKGNMKVNSRSKRGRPRSLKVPNVQKEGNSEVAQPSSQNLEDFINMEVALSEFKKEPENDYTSTENSTSEALVDIQPVLNIKQEIMDADETDGLPVISSYGSLVTTPSLSLPPQPIIVANSESFLTTISEEIITEVKPRTAETTMQNVSAVAKVLERTSQAVVYDQTSNTYKVVSRLSVNNGAYSSIQYKTYIPCTLPASTLSLQQL